MIDENNYSTIIIIIIIIIIIYESTTDIIITVITTIIFGYHKQIKVHKSVPTIRRVLSFYYIIKNQ
jgi:hypothetical protein